MTSYAGIRKVIPPLTVFKCFGENYEKTTAYLVASVSKFGGYEGRRKKREKRNNIFFCFLKIAFIFSDAIGSTTSRGTSIVVSLIGSLID